MKVKGETETTTYWSDSNGYWSEDESEAAELSRFDAEALVRRINITNQLRSARDRVTPSIVESK